WLSKYVRRIGLVRKLRETRVLTGFSRLVPKTDRGDPAVQPLSAEAVGWLPAIEIRGEGIFIEFVEEELRTWAAKGPPVTRTAGLIQAYRANRAVRKLSERRIDARFMMIHTIAHALIKELTFTCGYGSASLRERLYCNIEDPDSAMNGVLIYTASGDSEGTLGGLVAQARPGQFERLFEDALRRSQWCSNDPVCIESPGQGAGSFNLAACHGCVLLPETSCEEGNRLLDRGLLCGTLAEATTGFFCDVPLG
ncbi:MAG: DrmB family protein, partial [Acidobacteriota bacterium]